MKIGNLCQINNFEYWNLTIFKIYHFESRNTFDFTFLMAKFYNIWNYTTSLDHHLSKTLAKCCPVIIAKKCKELATLTGKQFTYSYERCFCCLLAYQSVNESRQLSPKKLSTPRSLVSSATGLLVQKSEISSPVSHSLMLINLIIDCQSTTVVSTYYCSVYFSAQVLGSRVTFTENSDFCCFFGAG